MTGVPPSGSGSRASHEAATASSPKASIPNADGHYEVVMVHWIDSAQPASHWQWLEDYEPSAPVMVETVGWLVADGEVIGVAQSLGGAGDLADQMMGVVHIPRRAVTNIIPIPQDGSAQEGAQ